MNEVRIKLLWLQNFKGLKQFEISDFGDGISIYGDNATGKTTIFDAFSWLLFGKDSLNSAIFEIKPLTDTGEALHGLEHEVSSTLVTSAGEIEFRKVYSEKYTKRRGEAKRTFTGHTVDHFVNGVPCLQKQYNKQVSEICNEDIFRLLTNPRHFNEVLHWTDRRNLLLEVCGDIDDDTVIESNTTLADLKNILGKHTVDDQKKIIASKRAEINRELLKIPTRIDEIVKSKIEIDDDLENINEKLKLYDQKKTDAESTLAAIKSGGGIEELTRRLAKLETKTISHRNKMATEETNRLKKQVATLATVEKESIQAAKATEKAVVEQTQKMKLLKEINKDRDKLIKKRDELRDQWIAVDAQKFIPIAGENICEACGQPLPADQVKNAAEKALKVFNLEKAKKLSDISDLGRSTKDEIDQHELDIKSTKASIAKDDEIIKRLAIVQGDVEKKHDDLKAHFKKTNQSLPPDIELDNMIAAEDAVKLEINGLRAGNYETEMAAVNELEKINEKIQTLQRNKLQIEGNKRVDYRVVYLKAQEKSLALEFENLESDLFTIEEFIRTKTMLLNEKIREKFKLASFRLFVENINGGLDKCCDTTLDGVPYNSMNNGARINIGLDICNTLSEHYGIRLPCFIDNAEALTRVLQTSAQQIRLYVSEDDKKLRIEKH